MSRELFMMYILSTFPGDLTSCKQVHLFRSQYLIGPLTSQENRCLLETANAEMGAWCPSRVHCSSNVTLSHTLIVLSVEAEKMWASLSAKHLTDPSCPDRMCTHFLEFASQMRIFLSNEPETTLLPTPIMHKTVPVWPTRSETSMASRSRHLIAFPRKGSLCCDATWLWAKKILFSIATMAIGVPDPSCSVASSNIFVEGWILSEAPPSFHPQQCVRSCFLDIYFCWFGLWQSTLHND